MTTKSKTNIDKMTAHFRNKISGEMKHITVPEWEDMKIYFKEEI